MAHTVRTYNNQMPAICNTLENVQSVQFVIGATGGHLSANIEVYQGGLQLFRAIWAGYKIEIVDEFGDVVWEGVITSIPITLSESGNMIVNAVGFLYLLSAITGTWLPNYPASTGLKTMITDGLTLAAPGISWDLTTFPNTGVSAIYTPGNTASPRSHIDELIKYGDSSNRGLFWQILNDRKFWVFSRPTPLTTYDYNINFTNCSEADLGISLDNFYTRVSIRWRDATTTYITPFNNLAMQTLYGQSLGSNDPAGTRLPYIREPDPIDISGHGVLTLAQATQIGNTLKNKYSNDGVRITASKIIIIDGQAVRNANNGAIVNLSKVRPAKNILLADIPGSSGNLGPSSASMFVGQTQFTESYDSSGGVSQSLEITGEDVVVPANLLAALIAQLPKEPA